MPATDGLQYCKCAAKFNSLSYDDYHHVPLGWSEFVGGYNTPESTVEVGQTETI